MTKLFYKAATCVATTVAICYAVMNYQLRRELEASANVTNIQLQNEVKMLNTVQASTVRMLGMAINRLDEVDRYNDYFGDVISEGNDFDIVYTWYSVTDRNFFVEAGLN